MVAPVSVSDLLDRMRDRLSQRAAQVDMDVVVDADVQTLERVIRVDAAAVEQILFNLVDNACKYAHPHDSADIRIRAATPADASRGGAAAVTITVQDDGPGLSPAARKRLFCPFSKSATDAAHSAPGVGLGLSLSRKLARGLGGDLTYDAKRQSGACFVLRLGASR